MIIVSESNIYEVINFQRKDGLYNVYVQKTTKLGTYKGEATLQMGSKNKLYPVKKDVINLRYEI